MATLTTTRLGIPYPDGNERVMDGDNAMGAIANHLDSYTTAGIPRRFASGSVPIQFASDTSHGATVTYPVGRFDALPFVVAVITVQSSTMYVCQVTNLAVGSCQILAARNDGASGATALVTAYWAAFQI